MLIAQIVSHSSSLVPTGIGLGSVIAALCSWERNHSILWAIVAGILSWVYVVYYALTRRSRQREAHNPIPQFPLGIRRDRELRPPPRK